MRNYDLDLGTIKRLEFEILMPKVPVSNTSVSIIVSTLTSSQIIQTRFVGFLFL